MNIKENILIILFIFLLNGHIVYAMSKVEENLNEISKYRYEQIKNEIMKPVSVLQSINLNIYNVIMEYIPENESVENYYYYYYISSMFLGETGDSIIIHDIYYYEILLNKNKGVIGDPTGKCFTIEFYLNKEFIRGYYWR